MGAPVIEVGQSKNVTATGNVTTVSTQLMGFNVNSTTAGTVIFRDGGSGGTVLNGVYTPAAGYNAFPCACPNGLHVTVGGTIDLTFFYIIG